MKSYTNNSTTNPTINYKYYLSLSIMDIVLNQFYCSKKDFFSGILSNTVSITPLIIGLVLTCRQQELGSSLDLLNSLDKILSVISDNSLKAQVLVKFNQELLEYTRSQTERHQTICDLFLKFGDILGNTQVPCLLQEKLAGDFSQNFKNLLKEYARSGFFSKIYKCGQRNSKLLRLAMDIFSEDIENELIIIEKATHLSSFLFSLNKLLQSLWFKPLEITDEILQFVSYKGISFTKDSSSTTADSEIRQVLTKFPKFFPNQEFFEFDSKSSYKKIDNIRASDSLAVNPELRGNSPSKIRANGMKIAVKPYTDDEILQSAPPASAKLAGNSHIGSELIKSPQPVSTKIPIKPYTDDEFRQSPQRITKKVVVKPYTDKQIVQSPQPVSKIVVKTFAEEEIIRSSQPLCSKITGKPYTDEEIIQDSQSVPKKINAVSPNKNQIKIPLKKYSDEEIDPAKRDPEEENKSQKEKTETEIGNIIYELMRHHKEIWESNSTWDIEELLKKFKAIKFGLFNLEKVLVGVIRSITAEVSSDRRNAVYELAVRSCGDLLSQRQRAILREEIFRSEANGEEGSRVRETEDRKVNKEGEREEDRGKGVYKGKYKVKYPDNLSQSEIHVEQKLMEGPE